MKLISKIFLAAAVLAAPAFVYGQNGLSALHVEGNSLVNEEGEKVTLHGVMDTPNPYFNSWRWGRSADDGSVEACLEYFDKLFSAITDRSQGAYCDVFRLHLDPCWTNDPAKRSDGREQGEADISRFSAERLEKYMDALFCPIIECALAHGLYVVVRPPGVCPHDLRVGDDYQKYLLTVWDIVSRNGFIRRNSGTVSLELANEPVKVSAADGSASAEALHDYFQPLADMVRRNGFDGIVWVPGAGYQSDYRSYASHPVTGGNIGYAVHVYPGWYGASDERCDRDDFISEWGESVPVAKTNPILVSEIDWSPEREGVGKRNEFGQWVASNHGTWGTASTSRWGEAWRAVHDHYGNISMTLTSTDDYVDMPAYLADGAVRPSFEGDPECCAKACFDWYREYAEGTRCGLTVEERAMTELSGPVSPVVMAPSTRREISVLCRFASGREVDVTSHCIFSSGDDGTVTVDRGLIAAHGEGRAVVSAEYTDEAGRSGTVSFDVEVAFFPLTEGAFDPSIWESGSFDAGRCELVTGRYGFGGWRFADGLDLSEYSALVVELKRRPEGEVSFRLFDRNDYWSKPCACDFGDSKRVRVDLGSMKDADGRRVDPSHIYIAGFWSEGGEPLRISRIYLER